MKTVDFWRGTPHVGAGVYARLKAGEKAGNCTSSGCMNPSSVLRVGGGSSVGESCQKLGGRRPCSHISSSGTSSSKIQHSNSSLGVVRFAEREFYPRRKWEETRHAFGYSDSRFRTSGRQNPRDCSAAEVLLVRSGAAIAGEGDVVAGEEVRVSQSEGGLYRPFADFAVRELGRRSDISPLLIKDEFRNMVARDGSTAIENRAFTSPKIRYFRSTYVNAGSSMQVLNVAGFSRPEYDVPIFCADFFSTPISNIIVLDLNPLYNTGTNSFYKERYYDDLMVLGNKHAKVLPWGDKLTAESMQFFSPLVLWTKAQGQDLNRTLYPAFQDYLLAWLSILDEAKPSVDPLAVASNQEAQHRYLTWRATKDPGRALLTRLYGVELSERFIEEYLFLGVKTLGTKSFLDYFPEYRTEDNTISKQRSIIGKSFSTRPWDEEGNFYLN